MATEDNEGYFNFIFSADTEGFNKAIDASIKKVNEAEKATERSQKGGGAMAVKKKLTEQLKKLAIEEFKAKDKVEDIEKRLNKLLERRKTLQKDLERLGKDKTKRQALHLANARNEARILGIQQRLRRSASRGPAPGAPAGGGGRLAGLGRGAKGLAGSFGRGGLEGLGRIPGMGGIAGLAGMGGGMAAIGPAAAALAGAAVVGGVGAGTIGMVGEATERRGRAAGIGVSTEGLHQLELAAEQSGVSVSAVDDALQHFKLAADEASKGNSKYVQNLARMGVSVEDITKKGVVNSFIDMMATMKDTEDAQKSLRDATLLVGSSASELVPAAMRDFAQAALDAKELGRVMSEEQHDSLAEASDAWKSLWTELKTLFAPVAIWIADAFKKALKWVIDFGFEMEALGAKLAIWAFGAGETWDVASQMADDLLAARRKLFEQEWERRTQGGTPGSPGMIGKDFSYKGLEARQMFPDADQLQRLGLWVGPTIPKEQLNELRQIKARITAQQAAYARWLAEIISKI